jgi:ComF family protein
MELLAPSVCAGCGLTEIGGVGFCGGCRILVEPASEKWRAPAPDAAVYCYGGPLADGLRSLKYAGRSELAPALGRMLAAEALAYAGLVDRVVPVPLHVSRLRERGFNQSALLAWPVARALGLPLDTGLLRRVRATMDQAGLAAGARAVNVRGSFFADAARIARRRGKRVLLIDDVRTTGSTLQAAADALHAAGCAEVKTLALALVEP